jgi:hypothetical protein
MIEEFGLALALKCLKCSALEKRYITYACAFASPCGRYLTPSTVCTASRS